MPPVHGCSPEDEPSPCQTGLIISWLSLGTNHNTTLIIAKPLVTLCVSVLRCGRNIVDFHEFNEIRLAAAKKASQILCSVSFFLKPRTKKATLDLLCTFNLRY